MKNFSKSAISRTLKIFVEFLLEAAPDEFGWGGGGERATRVEEAEVFDRGRPGRPASLIGRRRSGGRARRASPTARARSVTRRLVDSLARRLSNLFFCCSRSVTLNFLFFVCSLARKVARRATRSSLTRSLAHCSLVLFPYKCLTKIPTGSIISLLFMTLNFLLTRSVTLNFYSLNHSLIRSFILSFIRSCIVSVSFVWLNSLSLSYYLRISYPSSLISICVLHFICISIDTEYLTDNAGYRTPRGHPQRDWTPQGRETSPTLLPSGLGTVLKLL